MKFLKNKNNRKIIKKKAFEEPKGVFAKGLLCILVITSLINIFLVEIVNTLNYDYTNSIIFTIIILLTIILITPLTFNYMNLFLLNSKDEIITFSDLFKNKKQALKYTIHYTKIIVVYTIITFIISLLPFIGFLINLIIEIIFIPVFIFMPFIYLENNNLSTKQLLSKTFEIVKNKRVEIYGLIFSFIFWFILGLCTLGLLYFWLVPYMLIAITYQYQNFKDNKLKKENSLSNQSVILIFICLILVAFTSLFINNKDEFNNLVNTTLNYKLLQNKGKYQLKYSDFVVATYNIPKDYHLAYETKTTKTFTNDENILQFTVYLSDEKELMKIDKDLIKDIKNPKEEQLKVNLNGKKLNAFKYENEKENTIIVYYPKDSFTVTITLTSIQNTLTTDNFENIQIY